MTLAIKILKEVIAIRQNRLLTWTHDLQNDRVDYNAYIDAHNVIIDEIAQLQETIDTLIERINANVPSHTNS